MSQWYQWIKDAVRTDPASCQNLGGKTEAMAVTESLLTEMEYQIRVAEQEQKEKEEVERQAKGGADYSWLVGSTFQHYTVPELQRMDLEDLCVKIKATECSDVISMFRDALLNKHEPHEIPQVLRAVLNQVIASHAPLPDEASRQTMGSWMMKSLTRLRPTSHRKISPASASNLSFSTSAASEMSSHGPIPRAWSEDSAASASERHSVYAASEGRVSNATTTSSFSSATASSQGPERQPQIAWTDEMLV